MIIRTILAFLLTLIFAPIGIFLEDNGLIVQPGLWALYGWFYGSIITLLLR